MSATEFTDESTDGSFVRSFTAISTVMVVSKALKDGEDTKALN